MAELDRTQTLQLVCAAIRVQTKAAGAVVIVLDKDAGLKLVAELDSELDKQLPQTLKLLSDQVALFAAKQSERHGGQLTLQI